MEDFTLSEIEQDIIKKHMFPLTAVPPSCLEAWIVCAADKWCSARRLCSGERKRCYERHIFIQGYETGFAEAFLKYQGLLKVFWLAKTADGNRIYGIRLGNPAASKNVVIQASMHGRNG